MFLETLLTWLMLSVVVAAAGGASRASEYASHPPTRSLPVASPRPATAGPAYYVDARQGNDAQAGTLDRPWRTLQHAADRLRAGDTLYLRSGTYYEHVLLTVSGQPGRPVTIRAYPGELAIVDGGLREFFEQPAEAWQPCPGGADGEFWSRATYPELGGRAGETNVLGNFGDSLVPLHGYRFRGDLQSDNPYWNVRKNVGDEDHVSCGPGLWYDVESARIHVRLSHTRLPGLGPDNYRGETDPRRLPLVIAGYQGGSVLTLRRAAHVRLQDLVLRGAREATLSIEASRDIELDGLTIYGGASPVQVRDTDGLRMQHTACRGLAAPWTFRGSLKYRAIESRLFSASGWEPTGADNRNFELAYCEFTDSVDGVFIGNVRRVLLHHNYLDNVSDDGVFLTAATAYDGTTHGGDVVISQNVFARCLTTFAFGVGHGRQKTMGDADQKQTGSGVWIVRNVFDFRRPVMYYWPTGPDAPQEISSLGRVAGDHGSPAWEPMWILHNTILAGDPPRYDYGTDGLGKAMGHGTRRRVFNNIICQMQGAPGEHLPPAAVDYQADGNLFWSVSEREALAERWLSRFRGSDEWPASRRRYPPGWTTHDRYAEPGFRDFSADWKKAVDLQLLPDSPAADAGVPLPLEWFDPLRQHDAGGPDIGALPQGAPPWRVGIRGRLTASGAACDEPPLAPTGWQIDEPPADPPAVAAARAERVAVIQGYPAFDAPLVTFAFRKLGCRVDEFERQFVAPSRFFDYDIVVIDGSFARAGITPTAFTADDLRASQQFLERGGTLWLMRERTEQFATPEGQSWLSEITGGTRREPGELRVRLPDHAWLAGLPDESATWLPPKSASPLRTARGLSLIGDNQGASILYRCPVGQGQLVYVGWTIAAALPHGRLPSTVAQEAEFEQQMSILLNMARDVAR